MALDFYWSLNFMRPVMGRIFLAARWFFVVYYPAVMAPGIKYWVSLRGAKPPWQSRSFLFRL